MKYYKIDELLIAEIDPLGIESFLLRQFNNTDANIHIVTFNLDFLYTARKSSKFYNICATSDLIIPDGISIIWLIQLKYKTKIKRITGSDLFFSLLNLSHKIKFKLALVGSSQKVLHKNVSRINKYFPNIKIVYASSPPFRFENDSKVNDKIVNDLCALKPDVLIVALGSPRQEIWLNNYKNIIGAKINIGVGAVLDYYSGSVTRAPKVFQNLGLEWFWRFLMEPKRMFKRYFVKDLPFFIKLVYKFLIKKNESAF